MKPDNVCRLDFWSVYDIRSEGSMFVIPVNGSINKHDDAVMGRGLARDAADRYPFLRTEFGTLLRRRQHIVREMVEKQFILFPVKYQWHEQADVELIAGSCRQLSLLAKFWKYKMIYMPHVGCGNGGLDWEKDVRLVVEKNLSVPYVVIQPK
jgi:hypothetical protein